MTDQFRIDQTLVTAAKALADVSESPRLDAELLLCQALDVPRSYFFAHPEDTLDAAAVARFVAVIERRCNGEPLAYIHGQKEFWSLSLMVSPDTLVPRPETEVLVQEALSLIPREQTVDILDLGTGSGAIALAIANERPQCQVTATDVSESALAIARENARQLDISNVTFEHGAWAAPVVNRSFDLIVSNPPYVRADDPSLTALTYEPLQALAAGDDGLDAIRILAAQCRPILRPAGRLLLEHGADQEEEVARILEATRWTEIRCIKDLAGLPRVTIAVRHGEGS